MRFLDILVVLRLDLSQISFNLVENAFATGQLALLATKIMFYDLLAWECAAIKILRFNNAHSVNSKRRTLIHGKSIHKSFRGSILGSIITE